MMKRWVCAAMFILGTVSALAQKPGDGPLLTDLMQALQFAELLRAAALSREQLSALAELQARWLGAQQVPDEVAAAIQDVCLQVANGRSVEAAVTSLGVGEELRQGQEQSMRAGQTLAVQLREMLKADQCRALLAFTSPERGLAGMVEMLRQARKAPPPAWEQIRKDMSGAMAGFAGQRGTPAAAAPTAGELLDRVRQMPDAEFEKVAPDLPGQWARALAPEMMRQMDDPGQQEQRLLDVCRRLLGAPEAHDLLARLLAAPPPVVPAAVPAAPTPGE